MTDKFKYEIAKALTFFIFPKKKRHLWRERVASKLGVVNSEVAVFINWVVAKHKGLVSSADDIETLIIGDSHAQSGVVPFLIDEKTYNYAQNANDLFVMFESLKVARSHCTHLKNVICAIDFYNRGYNEVMGASSYKVQVVAKELGFADKVDFSVNQYHDYKHTDKIIAKVKAKKDHRLYCQGFDFVGMSPVKWSKKDYERAEHHFKIYAKYNNQLVWFEKICRFCADNQLKLTVIVPPHRSDYEAYVTEKAGGRDVLADFKKICADYGLSLYDFRTGTEIADEDFTDPDHLNFNGAVKFSRQLKKLL